MNSTKKRILFVDDEPAILAGLQNLLYKDRKRWEMVFCTGGEPAIDQLRAREFDVVVSDMRMPGMDGATLLNRVKDEFPGTARIMLSGHAEREAIVRALPALHQLLAKPCDAETLRAAIERSVDHEVASAERIRAVIGRIDKLPSPPDIYFELTRAMQSSTTTLADVAAIVLRDPGLSAKLLQLVNSAYFGSGQKTSSIVQAVSLLGTERLRYIGLTASVFTPIENDPMPEFPLAEVQASSVRAATLARAFIAGAGQDEAFAAALFHDVGHVVLSLGVTDEYREVLSRARRERIEVSYIERERFGVTHAEVGACLLGLWGLPAPILDIVRYHHRPDLAPEPLRMVTSAVHVADALAAPSETCVAIDRDALARAGTLEQLDAWLALAEAL